MNTPKIIGVAIRLNGKVYSLLAPNRHHHVIRMMVEEHKLPPPILGEQGFILDDKNLFVGRRTARLIAIQNGQCKHPSHPKELFSEDLW